MSSKPRKQAAVLKNRQENKASQKAVPDSDGIDENIDSSEYDESQEVVEKLSAVANLDPELKSKLTPELLERVSKNPKVIAMFQQESFQGPLPPPAMLLQYNQILPGGAERIFRLTEKEQEHRHKTQSDALLGAVSRDKRGQWMGFCIAMVVLIMAAFFANRGNTWFAGTLATLDLVGLTTVFVYGRKKPK
ncbi:DUF2335 domain-containing protein [Escherichia coli]|uniref:DUF2335 domain-containing protein n=1 Tax=Escherichia coli TaxID=562 RepID=UPI000DF00315|nr:DUF2335 domain-containing protein [Escherichia coli]MDT9109326.1 DUF2335 domain-containing protein [Escherichia coli]